MYGFFICSFRVQESSSRPTKQHVPKRVSSSLDVYGSSGTNVNGGNQGWPLSRVNEWPTQEEIQRVEKRVWMRVEVTLNSSRSYSGGLASTRRQSGSTTPSAPTPPKKQVLPVLITFWYHIVMGSYDCRHFISRALDLFSCCSAAVQLLISVFGRYPFGHY